MSPAALGRGEEDVGISTILPLAAVSTLTSSGRPGGITGPPDHIPSSCLFSPARLVLR